MLQNCRACCVFETNVESSGAWHLSFGFWHRILGLARNVESLALGGLPLSCEPLCRWISGKFSAATHDPQPSGAHVVQFQHVWKGCSNVLQGVLLLCLNEVAQIQ